MRYLLYGVVGLIALLVGAVAVGPAFVDWGRYKDDIAAAVHEATGRTLQINGDLDLSILPSPRLSASDVRFLTQPGSGRADMAHLGALQVHVRLMPLLAGEIAVTSMTLVEPEVVLEVGKDGTTNWDLPAPARPPEDGPAQPGGGATEDRAAADVRLDGLRIENGTFVYRSLATGVERRLESINAEVSAGSLRGPFEFTGTLQSAGAPIDYSVSVGALGENDAATVDLRVVSRGTGESELAFDGVLAEARTAPTLAGTLTGKSADIAGIAALATASGAEAFPAWRGRPIEFKARLSASPSDLALNELALDVAGTKAAGALTVAWREEVQIDAALRARALDLDKFLRPGAGGTATGERPAGPSTGPGAVGELIPGEVKGSIDIAIDTATLMGEQLREIRATANLEGGRLAIDQASARLPGGAELSLSGVVSAREGAPVFEGRVNGHGNNLRAMLQWLGLDVGDIPRDRLGRFNAVAEAEYAGDLVTLSDLDATFDATRIRGGLTYAVRARPSFGATLAVDRINLDAYLPPPAPRAKPEEAGGANAGPQPDASGAAGAGSDTKDSGNASGGVPGLSVLKEFDANVMLRVDSLTLRQTAIHGVRLNGTLMAGKLTIQEAAVQSLGGTAVDAAGTVEGFDGFPAFNGTLHAKGGDAAGALRVLGVTAGPAVDRLGAFELSGTGAADGSKLTLDAKLAVAGAALGVKGSLGNFRDKPVLDLAVSANHADFAALTTTLTGDEPPQGSGDRRVGLSGTAKGPWDAIQVAGNVGIAGAKASITGNILFPLDTRGVDLAISAEHPELFDLLRSLASDYAPAAGKAGPVSIAAQVEGTPSALGFDVAKATVGPSALSGKGKLILDGARPSLTATLAASNLVLDPFLAPEAPGAADAAADGAGQTPESPPGASPGLSRERLDLSLLDALDAQVTLQANSVSGGRLRIDDAVIKATLKDQVLTVTRAEGRLYDGTVSLNGTLNGSATPAVSGTLTVRRAELQKVLRDTAGVDVARGPIDLDLQVSGAGRSEYDIVDGLDGSGTIVGRGGVIDGFNLMAISERLKDLDRTEDILTLVSAGAGGGQTRYSRLEGTFTIENGVVDIDDLKIVAEGGTVEARGSIQLAKRIVDVESGFRLSEHPDAPPFRMRLRGPWDDPRRFLDFQDLQAFLVRRSAENLMKRVMPVTEETTEPAAATPNRRPSPPPPERKPEPPPDKIDPNEILKGLLQAIPKNAGE